MNLVLVIKTQKLKRVLSQLAFVGFCSQVVSVLLWLEKEDIFYVAVLDIVSMDLSWGKKKLHPSGFP